MSKRILLLGGGIAGAECLKHLQSFLRHKKQYSLVVVDKNNFTSFIPMLHEVAMGSVAPLGLTHSLRQILSHPDEYFLQAEVQGIDLGQKEVKTSKKTLSYDYLVVSLGSLQHYFGVSGAKDHTIRLKHFQDSVGLRNRLIDAFEQASQMSSEKEQAAALHFVLIGAGYTGVETAGQMAQLFNNEFRDLYKEINPDIPRVTIVQGADRILPTLTEKSSAKGQKRLENLGVEVMTGVRAVSVTPEGVSLNNGKVLSSKNVIWTSGIKACGDEFFEEDRLIKGRVKVKSTLQVPDHPEVFVLGDLAAIDDNNGPDPQTAQAATQQAKVVARNLEALIKEDPLTSFHYHHKGDLVPIGDYWAIAEIFGFRFTGVFAWLLRRYVYLMGLYGISDRIRIVFDWVMNIFSRRDTTRL